MLPLITIYTLPDCVYCVKAKWYLKTFLPLYNIEDNLLTPTAKVYLEDLYSCKISTAPQIVIGGVYIGGYTDLVKWVDDM